MDAIATPAVTTPIKVSLAPAARHAPGPIVACASLLDRRGARVVLGAADAPFGVAEPVVPDRKSVV